MRISDWSSDVCSSDLPSGNRSTPAKRPRSSASATASCSICSKGRRRTRSTSSRAAPPTRDPRLAPASPRRYLVRVLPYRRRDLTFLWHAETDDRRNPVPTQRLLPSAVVVLIALLWRPPPWAVGLLATATTTHYRG